jgi:glutaredoxin 3
MLAASLLCSAFVINAPHKHAALRSSHLHMQEGPLAAAQAAFEIFQASKAEGMDFKQSVADAIAGEYDYEAVTTDVKSLASSAPVVFFTWESSPACKKALKLIAESGVSPKVVRLDDPWAEGHPKRAALGRLTGKSSVPSVWIGGEYIGGCDDGPSDAAPGLVPLAFRGTLREKLEAAGALVEVAPSPTAPVAADE